MEAFAYSWILLVCAVLMRLRCTVVSSLLNKKRNKQNTILKTIRHWVYYYGTLLNKVWINTPNRKNIIFKISLQNRKNNVLMFFKMPSDQTCKRMKGMLMDGWRAAFNRLSHQIHMHTHRTTASWTLLQSDVPMLDFLVLPCALTSIYIWMEHSLPSRVTEAFQHAM